VVDGWRRTQVPPLALGQAFSPPYWGAWQGTGPLGSMPVTARRGTRPCHQGWRRPHVHIFIIVSGVVLLLLTGTGQDLLHDRLHSLRRPVEDTSIMGRLDKAAYAVCNVELVCLGQLSKTAQSKLVQPGCICSQGPCILLWPAPAFA
jgi:hypothetical protein